MAAARHLEQMACSMVNAGETISSCPHFRRLMTSSGAVGACWWFCCSALENTSGSHRGVVVRVTSAQLPAYQRGYFQESPRHSGGSGGKSTMI